HSRMPGPLGVRFDLRPRRLHHPAVLHTGWAGRLTSAARQAQVDVLPIRWADRRTRRHLNHLINSTAPGVHLDAQLAIGRPGVQAEPTMHAAVEIRLARSQLLRFRYDDTIGHGLRVPRGRTYA